MNPLLEKRSQSGFPLSIGTSLSLESVLDPVQPVYDETRVVPKIENITSYTMLAFNVSTLLRNIISSIPFKEAITIPFKDYYEVLLDEIEFLFNTLALTEVPSRFYVNTYKYVNETYKDKDCLRKVHTEKQVYIDNIIKYCLDKIRKDSDVDIFHKDIKYSKEDRLLVMTHVPFDLLSYDNFIKLDLLESHTGLIKTRKDWWTKYYPMPGDLDMSFLPLLEYFLTVFGDNVMFSPADISKRKDLYTALKNKGVTPLSSELSISFMLK